METKYHIDLLEEGFTVTRRIDDMYLYRKKSEVVLAKVGKDGELEIMLKLDLIEDERRTKVFPYH